MPGRRNGRYSLGAVVRLTGLSPHVLRAWERRYGAVRPERSAGGTRRYGERDVARLRLLAAATQAGHRIGHIAGLDDTAIERLLASPTPGPPARSLEAILVAVDELDPAGLERLATMHFLALGPIRFAREIAAPLLRAVGDRWEQGRLTVAAEHMVSSVTRGLLGAALRPPYYVNGSPRLLFATPVGERHEFGLLIAAVTALGAGANVTYLGPDLPVEELVGAAERTAPIAVGLSLVNPATASVRRYLRELRRRLPERTRVWVGGPSPVTDVAGVERVDDLDDLALRISLLRRLPGKAS